jgi:hypothetical protein
MSEVLSVRCSATTKERRVSNLYYCQTLRV